MTCFMNCKRLTLELICLNAVAQHAEDMVLVSYLKFGLDQGPVVQSVVSLASSLRGQLVKCFTAL